MTGTHHFFETKNIIEDGKNEQKKIIDLIPESIERDRENGISSPFTVV